MNCAVAENENAADKKGNNGGNAQSQSRSAGGISACRKLFARKQKQRADANREPQNVEKRYENGREALAKVAHVWLVEPKQTGGADDCGKQGDGTSGKKKSSQLVFGKFFHIL